MPEIILSNKKFDIDGIVFDKDGTLIDFHATWGPILRGAVDKLLEPFAEKNCKSTTPSIKHWVSINKPCVLETAHIPFQHLTRF